MQGAVMTCPQRADTWPDVRERFPGWALVADSGVGVPENFCRTLERAADVQSFGWAVMAQDDVAPLPGLVDGLAGWLGQVPADAELISGFSLGWKRDPRDVHAGVRWRKRRKRELLWVMLLAVRVKLVDAVVAGVRAGTGPHDDERLSKWLDATGRVAYVHLPSVVQHIGRVSVMGKGWTIGGRPRQSPTYPEGKTLRDVLRD